MVGIHTEWDTAKVVKLEVDGDRPNENDVRKPMDVPPLVINQGAAITLAVISTRPDPAGARKTGDRAGPHLDLRLYVGGKLTDVHADSSVNNDATSTPRWSAILTSSSARNGTSPRMRRDTALPESPSSRAIRYCGIDRPVSSVRMLAATWESRMPSRYTAWRYTVNVFGKKCA